MATKMTAFGFIIVGVIAILFAIGLISGILNPKSSYLKLYGGVLSVAAVALTALITYVFDTTSSKKSDNIFANTESTKRQVTILDEKADTSIEKLETIKKENIELQNKVISLQDSQIEKNNQILELGEKLKLTTLENQKISNENLALSSKIKFPLPNNIDLSCKFSFKLNEVQQKEADKILLNEDISDDPKVFSLIRPEVVFRTLRMNFAELIRVSFSKKIEIDKNSVTVADNLLNLSGYIDITNPQLVTVNYNKSNRIFIINCHKIELKREIVKLDYKLSSNLNPYSIHDLENSTLAIWCYVRRSIEENTGLALEDVFIKSNELNLTFIGQIPKTENKSVFLCTKDLKL